MKIGLLDKEFAHIADPTRYTDYGIPEHIEWDRETPENNKIVVFTERCYNQVLESRFKDKIKIAWALEPAVVHPYAYDLLKTDIINQFNYVLTHHECFAKWLEKNTKVKPVWWTPGGSFIWPKDWRMYKKTKNVQIIASEKTFAPGHKLRHEVIKKYADRIDLVCGRGYIPYDYQLDVLKDFRFAIVIENCDVPNYWSDKLLDCFLTGTVPIMWNSGWIEKYFNKKGMILWQDIDDLNDILSGLNESLYADMGIAIQENFMIARGRYGIVENYLYQSFFKELTC